MIRRILIVFTLISYLHISSFSQSFYYIGTSLGINSFDFVLGVYDPTTCKDSVIVPIVVPSPILSLYDIAITSNGQFYVIYDNQTSLNIGKLDAMTGIVTFEVELPSNCNSLTADENDLLYLGGAGFITYNISTGVLTELNPLNFGPAGDFTYWNGELYCVDFFNALWKVNLNDPSNSTPLFTFDLPPFSSAFGIVSSALYCGETQGFLTSTSGDYSQSSVYAINYNSQTPTLLCNAERIFYGAASVTESANSNCKPYCDLDEDNSSGQTNVNFQNQKKCDFQTLPISDVDLLISSSFTIDSAHIWIDQGNINTGFEGILVQNTGGLSISGQGTSSVIITNTLNANTNIFQQTIGSIVWQNLSANPSSGIRRIAVLLYANERVSDTAYAYLPVYYGTTKQQSFTICQGDTTTIGNHIYTNSGIYRDTLSTVFGCDSILVSNITVLPIENTALVLKVCEGDSVLYQQTYIQVGENKIFTFTGANGCDSTVSVTVNAYPSTSSTLMLQACVGDSTLYLQTYLKAGETRLFTYQNVLGCDSIVTVIVNTVPFLTSELTLKACQGDSVLYNQTLLPSGANENFNFKSVNGCDSIVTVMVETWPAFDFDINIQPACNSIGNGGVLVENITGGADPYSFSLDGINFQMDTFIQNLANGNYTIFAKDDNNCTTEKLISIPLIEPFDFLLPPATIPCGSTEISISPQITGSLTNLSYKWSTGDTSSYIIVKNPETIWLEINNECEVIRKETNVYSYGETMPDSLLYFPRAFNPSSANSENKEFRIFSSPELEILSFTMAIYDRWGGQVFQSDNISQSWTGNWRKKEAQSGVYVWWIAMEVFVCGEKTSYKKSGDVLLLK
jgi:CHU_C Type IX secretion signal domain